MLYNENDIDFSKISHTEFENLCYEILPFFGFSSLTWRQGGADNGRDIEAKLLFNSSFISDHYTKWFFECKHYTNGVPPEELNSKIAWADAQRPDFFCMITSSYITNGARVWLEALMPQKPYKIFVIEGVELKRKLVTVQNLIPKYFSEDKYLKLYDEIKRHNSLYNISPSYEVIEIIVENIPSEKFDLNDIGFLLKNFYGNFRTVLAEDSFTGKFNEKLPLKLLLRLKELSNQVDIAPFVKDIDFLGGHGFIDKTELEEENKLTYQEYALHLNSSDELNWDLGIYILVIVDKKQAFELFFSKKANFETNAFFYDNYNEEVLDQILHKLYPVDFINEIKKYSKGVL